MFLRILLFSLIPFLSMLAGGAFATVRKPGDNLRSFILHLAAGVVFSVVAVEILPDVLRNHSPVRATIGFVLGFAVMVGVRKLTETKGPETGRQSSIPWSLLLAIAVDVFIDGLLLGIAFSAGQKEGILLSIALGIELLSLGLATGTELSQNGLTKKRSIRLVSGLAAVFLISAVLGATLLQNLSNNALEIFLSFGLSALLFLVTEELLTEAHETEETIWHTSAFFAGFLLFMLLGMYV
jgi:zinc transporter, ZIP family